MKRLTFTLTVTCLSFIMSFGQSSSTKYWNVYDCKLSPSACVDKTHLKEAYGTSLVADGQTYSPSVTLDVTSGMAIATIVITMPDNQSFLPKKYEYEIAIGKTITESNIYVMAKMSNCARPHEIQCYHWQKQSSNVSAHTLAMLQSAFRELVKQDGAFAPFF